MDGRVAAVVAGSILAACAGGLPATAQEAPPARIPTPPISGPPVGFTPVDPIRESINGGSTLSAPPAPRVGLFRRLRGTPPTPAPAPAPTLAPLPGPLPKSDAATVPSSLFDGGDLVPPGDPAGRPAIPAGRPAPYANQQPAAPRVQATAGFGRTGERPAPHARELPAAPRPQAPPRQPVAVPGPAEDPAPAPPPLDPVQARPDPLPEPATPGPVAATAPASEVATEAAPPALAAIPPASEPVHEAAPAPTVDAAIKPASIDQATSLRTSARTKSAPVASRRAASVGSEVITMHELELEVNKTIERYGQGQKPDRATLNKIAAQVLDNLIEESLISQEAQRKFGKSPKNQVGFNAYANERFRDEELIPLLRRTGCVNEGELNDKLVAKNEPTVEEMREAFRRRIMTRDFLWMEIKSKVSADMVEMRKFYEENLSKFDRPAQITWREIEVDLRKSADPAAARKKLDAAVARLRAGEDFAAVARALSDGATASKGGAWATSPGSFGDPGVNAALDTLPPGVVSAVIESPASLRVVRVDGRRDAGPAQFHEVQDQIRNAVFERNFDKARNAYIQKLRKTNLVVTIFDDTASDPSKARSSAR